MKEVNEIVTTVQVKYRKKELTEDMIAEMEELKKDPDVKLARDEQKIKYRLRQELYQLRNLKKRGQALRALGLTKESLERALYGDEED